MKVIDWRASPAIRNRNERFEPSPPGDDQVADDQQGIVAGVLDGVPRLVGGDPERRRARVRW